jgi:hypothetical protein
MKKVILFAAGLLTVSMANAQVGFGVLGGVNANNQIDHYQGESVSNQLKVGFHVGGIVDFALNENWSIQPGLMYIMKGGLQERSAEMNTEIGMLRTEVKDKLSLSYVEMPVNVVYKVPMNNGGALMFGAGGYAATLLEAHTVYSYKATINGEDVDAMTQGGKAKVAVGDDSNDQIHRFDFGATGMLGYKMANGWFVRGGVDVGLFDIIRANNTNGFANSQPNTTAASANPESKNISYLLSVGYIF